MKIEYLYRYCFTFCLILLPLLTSCGVAPVTNSQQETTSSEPRGSNIQDIECGDGVRLGEEVCDTENLNSESCESLGFDGGSLACNEDCTAFDTSGCYENSSRCGDGIINSNEACDGTSVGAYTCEDFGFSGGVLICNSTCDNFDLEGCNRDEPPLCGNGIQEADELCDGFDVDGVDCSDFGFSSGQVVCNSTCDGYDTTNCNSNTEGPHCGNNAREDTERCDGTDLAGQSCQSLGFSEGVLLCNATCSGFNTTQCIVDSQPVCGDNVSEGSEVCDGTDLKQAQCSDFNFASGQLLCKPDCSGYITTHCVVDVPPCNTDCPDSWIGDNECDPSCNTSECNYDGGDCSTSDWLCDTTYYAGSDGCDCGCGVLDPDCASSYSTSCEFDHCPEHFSLSDTDNTQCVVPAEWICQAINYAASDGCDCGCGITDPDCDSTLASSCSYSSCPDGQEPDTYNNFICVTSSPPTCAPGCLPEWIGDGICDGECDNSNCDFDLGDCQTSAQWTCDLDYYGGEDGCDCGCGTHDPDCASYEASACSFNWCPLEEQPVSTNNAQCESVPDSLCSPGCESQWLGDGWCDEACYNPDCGYDYGDCD